jgi:hypothetical protein
MNQNSFFFFFHWLVVRFRKKKQEDTELNRELIQTPGQR